MLFVLRIGQRRTTWWSMFALIWQQWKRICLYRWAAILPIDFTRLTVHLDCTIRKCCKVRIAVQKDASFHHLSDCLLSLLWQWQDRWACLEVSCLWEAASFHNLQVVWIVIAWALFTSLLFDLTDQVVQKVYVFTSLTQLICTLSESSAHVRHLALYPRHVLVFDALLVVLKHLELVFSPFVAIVDAFRKACIVHRVNDSIPALFGHRWPLKLLQHLRSCFLYFPIVQSWHLVASPASKWAQLQHFAFLLIFPHFFIHFGASHWCYWTVLIVKVRVSFIVLSCPELQRFEWVYRLSDLIPRFLIFLIGFTSQKCL